MVSNTSMKGYFDLTIKETKDLQLFESIRNGNIHKEEEKLQLLEYAIEHLDITSLIAIHSTNYFPVGGKIQPALHFLTKMYTKNKVAQDLIRGKDLRHPRSTLHFTLNHSLKGTAAFGQMHYWNTKYTILVPLKDMIKRVASLSPVDTWVIGELVLPSSAEILIPESELNQWKGKSGKAKLIPYPVGKKIHDLTNTRIAIKGYAVVKGGDRSWYQHTDLQTVSTFIRKSSLLTEKEKSRLIALASTKGIGSWAQLFEQLKQKYKKRGNPHTNSTWYEIEQRVEKIYGPLFGLSDHELAQNIGARSPIDSFWSYGGPSVQEIIDGISHTLETNTIMSSEVRKTLVELKHSLERLESWLKVLNKKMSVEKKKANLTWREAYQNVGLIK